MNTFKLKDGFRVHRFLNICDVDYLFAKSNSEEFYTLLNLEMIGKFSQGTVDGFKEESKVVIINTDSMEMTAYNISEEEILKALMEMG